MLARWVLLGSAGGIYIMCATLGYLCLCARLRVCASALLERVGVGVGVKASILGFGQAWLVAWGRSTRGGRR
eukprot:scaffold21218_cov172-Isochrysis_galbana.AAC.1